MTTENIDSDEIKAKLEDRYGLSESESELKSSIADLLQGDIGISINFPMLIATIIFLLVAVGVPLYFFFWKRKP